MLKIDNNSYGFFPSFPCFSCFLPGNSNIRNIHLLHSVFAGLVAVDLIVAVAVCRPAAPQTSENVCSLPPVVDNPGMTRQSLNELFLPVDPYPQHDFLKNEFIPLPAENKQTFY